MALLMRLNAMVRGVVGQVDRADVAWLDDGGTCDPGNSHGRGDGARRVGRTKPGRVGCWLKALLLS